jgi:hypothetical protein
MKDTPMSSALSADVVGDVALGDPVLEHLRTGGHRRGREVDVALEQLVRVDEGTVGLGQHQLVPQLPERVLRAGGRERRHALGLEGIHDFDELVQRRGYGHTRRREHVLVVVDADELAVVRDAVPLTGAHQALVAVLGGRRKRAGELGVPAVLLGRVGERDDEALGGELAGRGVALVVLHHVRYGVTGEHDLGVLLDLLEGLCLGLDRHLGVLGLEDLDRLGPALAHGRVCRLVVPDGEGARYGAGGAA